MASFAATAALRASLRTSIRSSTRPVLRQQQQSAQFALRRTPLQRRFQSTIAQEAKETASSAAKEATKEQSSFQRLWNSPVGPKTVHFWAPIMKWGLVIAGIADFARPAEVLSLQQNAALLCTGLIWTRWCFIIKPKNYFLAAVNFFLFLVGSVQCTRVVLYRQSLKDKPLSEELKDVAKDNVETVKGIAKDPAGALKQAEKSASK